MDRQAILARAKARLVKKTTRIDEEEEEPLVTNRYRRQSLQSPVDVASLQSSPTEWSPRRVQIQSARESQISHPHPREESTEDVQSPDGEEPETPTRQTLPLNDRPRRLQPLERHLSQKQLKRMVCVVDVAFTERFARKRSFSQCGILGWNIDCSRNQTTRNRARAKTKNACIEANEIARN
jgi:hypothetical protein